MAKCKGCRRGWGLKGGASCRSSEAAPRCHTWLARAQLDAIAVILAAVEEPSLTCLALHSPAPSLQLLEL